MNFILLDPTSSGLTLTPGHITLLMSAFSSKHCYTQQIYWNIKPASIRPTPVCEPVELNWDPFHDMTDSILQDDRPTNTHLKHTSVSLKSLAAETSSSCDFLHDTLSKVITPFTLVSKKY
ncbi:hypothetical protein E3U43_017399 [Larimichthys crocea]|uniref:Uncharacterized protein n=1 Tax=Larimichthys crocea TaxID=215358 RepID=A0ACD3QYU6_LARCR|nr:hypothetical protein E3U43_017399 [Larimichthys crocea]